MNWSSTAALLGFNKCWDSQHGSSQSVTVQGPASCLDLLTQSAPPFWSSQSLHLRVNKHRSDIKTDIWHSCHEFVIWYNNKKTYPAGEAAEQHQKEDWPLCPDPSLQQTLHTWWYLCTAKWKMHHTCNSCTHTLSRVKKKGPHVHCDRDYIPGGLAVTYPTMFFQREENFIPTPVLSCGLKTEMTKHYLTHLNSVDISSCGLNFEVLTEKASFSTKCAIPLGYFASCLEPEFTKTKNKKERKTLYPVRPWRQVDIIKSISLLQLTSNCAELTKLVLGSYFETIF